MTQRNTVLVGMSLHPDATALLAQAAKVRSLPTEAEKLIDRIGEADAILTYVPSFDPALLTDARRLKGIACHACRQPMRDATRARGIQVSLVPSLWDTVADHAVALMFAVARQVPQAHGAIKRGEWLRRGQDLKVRFSGHDLFGSTLGIVGLGRIVTALARRVQGFEMRIPVRGSGAKATP
jgi:phosphoglycerate dehydrogenase-like enzyme